jgi:hypothetical protein
MGRPNGLTELERRFCEVYASNGGNGSKAARAAGYSGSDKSMTVNATRLLARASVREHIAHIAGKASEIVEAVRSTRDESAAYSRSDLFSLNSRIVRETKGHRVSLTLRDKAGRMIRRVKDGGRALSELRALYDGDQTASDGDQLRALRAAIIERLRSPENRRHLDALSAGTVDALDE